MAFYCCWFIFILHLLLIFNGKLLFSFLFPAFALLFCVPDLIPRDVCVPDELVCCSQIHRARSPLFYLAAGLRLFYFAWDVMFLKASQTVCLKPCVLENLWYFLSSQKLKLTLLFFPYISPADVYNCTSATELAICLNSGKKDKSSHHNLKQAFQS